MDETLKKTKNMVTKKKTRNKPPIYVKIKRRLRYGLICYSLMEILKKIGIQVSPYYLYQENIPENTNDQLKKQAEEYSLEILGISEIKPLEEKFRMKNGELLKLLESGEECIGMRLSGEIVAFSWVNYNEIRHKLTNINLKNNEAYLKTMHTLESHRGRNLAPILRLKCYDILKHNGKDIVYSISEYWNGPAVRFKEKLNAKKLKLILYVEVFNKFKRTYILKSYTKS